MGMGGQVQRWFSFKLATTLASSPKGMLRTGVDRGRSECRNRSNLPSALAALWG
jgi:hypothetical protein